MRWGLGDVAIACISTKQKAQPPDVRCPAVSATTPTPLPPVIQGYGETPVTACTPRGLCDCLSMPENPPPSLSLSLGLCHPLPQPLLEDPAQPYIGRLPPLILYYHLLPLLDYPSACTLLLASKLTFMLFWEAMQVSVRLEHLDRLWWRGMSLLAVFSPPADEDRRFPPPPPEPPPSKA